MNNAERLVKALQGNTGPQPYDTTATVTRIADDGTMYVHIDGGAPETPVTESLKAKAGDQVVIRVSGGRAWVTGNVTSPPTDDSSVKDLEGRFLKAQKITADQIEAARVYAKKISAQSISAGKVIVSGGKTAEETLSELSGEITTNKKSADDALSKLSGEITTNKKSADDAANTLKEIQDNLLYSGTTEINGGTIRTGTITALGAVTAGSFNLGNGKFKVGADGTLEATGATISGTLNSATINGSTISGGSISIGDGGSFYVGTDGSSRIWNLNVSPPEGASGLSTLSVTGYLNVSEESSLGIASADSLSTTGNITSFGKIYGIQDCGVRGKSGTPTWLSVYAPDNSERTILFANADKSYGLYRTTPRISFIYNDSGYCTHISSGSYSRRIKVESPFAYSDDVVKHTTSSAAANTRIQSSTSGWHDIAITSSSSRRYKHDIVPITDYRRLLSLDVVNFTYNDGYLMEGDIRAGVSVPGFIAEDVAEKYPVAADRDSMGRPEDWNFRYIIPGMLKLIQDHEARIKELEEKLE